MFLVMLMEIVLIIFAALAIFLMVRNKNDRSRLRLPPSYGWRHAADVLVLVKPCRSTTLDEFIAGGMQRLGKIFMMPVPVWQVMVSADPELNRFVLHNEPGLFEPCWPRGLSEIIGRTNMTLLHEGYEHKHLKSIVVSFFSPSRLRTIILRDADKLATAIVASWKEGEVFSAVESARQFSFNIMAKNILGMAPGDPEIETMRAEIESIVVGNFLCFFLNRTCSYVIPSFRRSVQARTNVLKIVKRIMRERKKKELREGDDLLGWMMDNTDITEEQISDTILGVLVAGHTPSKAIPMAMYFLAGCPQAVKRLREEHTRVMRSKEGGELTWDDYKQMEFTHCVINETLRLGNIARLIMKEASVDIKFKEYQIPKGCIVLVHFAGVHLNPNIFEDPESFNPWRWQCSSGGLKTTNDFMPFSGGPRLCAGIDLTKLEMAVFLHHLILKYDWNLVDDDHPLALPEVEFPKGLPIMIQDLST